MRSDGYSESLSGRLRARPEMSGRHGCATVGSQPCERQPARRTPRSTSRPCAVPRDAIVTRGRPGCAHAFKRGLTATPPPLERPRTSSNEEASSGGLVCELQRRVYQDESRGVHSHRIVLQLAWGEPEAAGDAPKPIPAVRCAVNPCRLRRHSRTILPVTAAVVHTVTTSLESSGTPPRKHATCRRRMQGSNPGRMRSLTVWAGCQ